MSNFDFLAQYKADPINAPRNKMAEIFHDGFVRRLKHCQDDAESLVDYAKQLHTCNVDVSEELDQAETFIKSLLLAVLLLKRQHSNQE